MMEGTSILQFDNLSGEVYVISRPNVYVRGILFGTTYMELGDTATIRCSKSDLICTIDFKSKVFLATCCLIGFSKLIKSCLGIFHGC